jgi:hypothetical protein
MNDDYILSGYMGILKSDIPNIIQTIFLYVQEFYINIEGIQKVAYQTLLFYLLFCTG